MKPIRIFSPSFELLAEIDDYEYFRITNKFHGTGSFELRINQHKQHTDLLVRQNIIILNNDEDKVGIITAREIGLDENGKKSEEWSITGMTLDGITSRRIAIPNDGQTHDGIKASAETALKHYVNNHLANPVNPSRKVEFLKIAEDLKRGDEIEFSSRYMILSNVLEEISEVSEIGWKIKFDLETKSWIFDCVQGVDRSTLQNEVPPVIFSTEFDSLREASFTDTIADFKNVAYVGGDGLGVQRAIEEVGTGVGLERYETYMDADTTSGISNEQQGLYFLKTLQDGITFEGVVNEETSPFIYGKDWKLGDIVSVVQKHWGIIIHPRVTEITEHYEASGTSFDVVFGKARPTVIDKVKSEVKPYQNTIRK